MPVPQHNESDPGSPFEIDGECVARIHHDAGRVPFLLLVDERGNAWRVYGYAQVSLASGGGGEWFPQKRAQDKMLEAWRKSRVDLTGLADLLKD